ncbi:MAG: hypothetical protein JW940_15375 [Polyangiaceae bacterium]|nr:hypothetical protein [Polyangiaceae bacterium]
MAASSERDPDEAGAPVSDGAAAVLVPAGAPAAGAVGAEPVVEASSVDVGALDAPMGEGLPQPTSPNATLRRTMTFDSTVAARACIMLRC